MAHYGQLRDYRFSSGVDDIRGAKLYGLDDEKLGEIDDVIFDHASGMLQYAIVDSGGWFSSNKFLVPADLIRPYAKAEDDFYVAMTKAQIEKLPRYDEGHFSKDRAENEHDWADYNRRYHESLETGGGVMHRENSTHTITPEPGEMPATGEPLPNEAALEPERMAGVFTDTAPNPNKTRMRPSGSARAEDSAVPGRFVPSEKPTELEEEGLNRRAASRAVPRRAAPVPEQRDSLTNPEQVYTSQPVRHKRLKAFEDHLRRNRGDITASCRSCGIRTDKVA